MSLDTVIVMGTLRADGTLELDERPTLAPGRVQVAIVPAQILAAREARQPLLDILDEIRANQTARGYQGRSIEEMKADEAAQRSEDEEYEERWRILWNPSTPAPPRGSDV
jgi:hypothetical protein